MVVMSFDELKLEEAVISQEFGYSTISQACEDLRRLVLIRVKKEAKELQVYLKSHYMEEVELYILAIPDGEGDVVLSPILVGLSLVTIEEPLPMTSLTLSREMNSMAQSLKTQST